MKMQDKKHFDKNGPYKILNQVRGHTGQRVTRHH